jgi:Rieske Fe-S protein
VPPPVSTSSGADPRTTPLASVADVAVGGAVFIDAKDVPGPAVPNGVVITQPKQGEFHAFSRDCTHMHCAVSDLRDGKIHCFCHQSLYSMTTGANVGGPAPRPLAKVPITVRAGKIFRA